MLLARPVELVTLESLATGRWNFAAHEEFAVLIRDGAAGRMRNLSSLTFVLLTRCASCRVAQ
jgi:hypothetical protein